MYAELGTPPVPVERATGKRMGVSASSEWNPRHSDNPEDPPVGYRVLSVRDGSPASQVTSVFPDGSSMRGELVSFFDIIIVINGNRLDTESDVFMRVIASHVDTVVTLSVFNCKAGRMRGTRYVLHC